MYILISRFFLFFYLQLCIFISWFFYLKEGTLKPGDTEQQKEFVCDQCGKVYGNYKSWFYHVKSHSVIYQCQTVSLIFFNDGYNDDESSSVPEIRI